MWHVWETGKVHAGIWWGDLRECDQLEDIGLNGTIVLKLIFKIWDGDMDWFYLAQDRDTWQAFVNAAMNLWVFIKCGEFVLFCCLFGTRRLIFYGVFNNVVSIHVITHCANFWVINIKVINKIWQQAVDCV